MNQLLELFDALEVPEMFKPYVTNVRVNLFEIAWLTREQVNLFRSDFRVVADYFVQLRENRNYIPSQEKLDHIQEVLQLLNVMDEDHLFENAQNEATVWKEVSTMSEWLQRALDESKTIGRVEGKAEGKAEGRTEGKAEGMAEGRIEGRIEGAEQEKVSGIQRAINKLHMTMDAAMDYMDIAIEERPRYAALLWESKTEYQAR